MGRSPHSGEKSLITRPRIIVAHRSVSLQRKRPRPVSTHFILSDSSVMTKDPSKLHKSKPKKPEGNKITGFRFGATSVGKASDRKSVASTKHGQSKSEIVVEVKDVVPRITDLPNDKTKLPETTVDVSKQPPQSPPKEIVRR